MNDEQRDEYEREPLWFWIIFGPIIWPLRFVDFRGGGLSVYLYALLVYAYIAVATVVITVAFLGMIVSGLHMIGIILSEWMP